MQSKAEFMTSINKLHLHVPSLQRNPMGSRVYFHCAVSAGNSQRLVWL